MESTALFVLAFTLGTILGLLIGFVHRFKYDGFLDVSEQDARQIHQLEIKTPPARLKHQRLVVFRVRKIPQTG